MGTRAQFFIGDPRDVVNRKWLGTLAWDGYPEGDCKVLAKCKTESAFRLAVAKLARKRDDFCDPQTNSFPFPWNDDLFLTDCTYAFFDKAVQYASYHNGFVPASEWGGDPDTWPELPHNTPAPIGDGPPGPDSIMILRVKR